ncbi:4-hydroxy-tetrahydrodipicolinate synthase [Tahibacter amnicola]|uniref:4-hydroxy-tetrahydrodipicolinate synthase n=1 Tax=Tahibacter amnicola TaxID=2976241 RepID=A0ABY6BBJ3_9GAMM|nr:4-hydroxy-tetrahydrodipicolinate synthase [Tahibacter amnicola]UXI66916.1 4-hydroxy-tetrahydrodipicolinate synthase [Tahibacter amnicola]
MKFSGSICALATPFGADDALDLDAFGRLIEFQIAGGTAAVVVAGSTGEAHALDEAEYERLLTFAVSQVRGRIPVIAGTGGANTRKTVATTQRAKACGANAALVVTPYYVRPTQEGLVRHYEQVAELGGLPVILYNVPGRTACDMQPQTVAALAPDPRVVGIKEAVADAARMRDLIALRSDGFSVLSGDDSTALRSLLDGADGVISVANNVAPRLFHAMCDAAVRGNRAQAEAFGARLDALFDALGWESNPIPLKWALGELGLGTARVRLPLTSLSLPHREPLRELVRSLQDAAV